MEGILLKLLIGVIVFGVIFAVLRIVLPNLTLPAWVGQIVYLVLSVIFLIWLIYLLLPLLHTAL